MTESGTGERAPVGGVQVGNAPAVGGSGGSGAGGSGLAGTVPAEGASVESAPVRPRAPRPDQWTVARRIAFLDHLAVTCNVVQSAKAVGSSPSGAHALRLRDADFAAQWRLALDAGYQQLEAKLLALALGHGDDGAVIGDPSAIVAGPFDPVAAFTLLRHQHAMRVGSATRAETRTTPFAFKHVAIEEVHAALLAKLAARAKRRPRSISA